MAVASRIARPAALWSPVKPDHASAFAERASADKSLIRPAGLRHLDLLTSLYLIY